LTEAFHSKGGDGFILFEGRAIMEHMSVCTRVMMTGVILGDSIVKYGKGGKNGVILELSEPHITICV